MKNLQIKGLVELTSEEMQAVQGGTFLDVIYNVSYGVGHACGKIAAAIDEYLMTDVGEIIM